MTTQNNSLTDKEYYQLTISIAKALNSYEMPIKSKHIRATIIGSYHANGGHAFWAIALRQPLQENRITAWKFCHVLHKLLREGHALCIQHSMRHRGQLTELGKLWGHLNDGYGLCIKQYTKLLVIKLNFHDRNARFPGSLVLNRGELEQIAANDINIYFQLAIEMFDYLDEIIALQATIFNSITTFAVSSMTHAGQLRLAPLIPCIQDSNQLYDFCVRLMFLLHANLDQDLLNGHRERFRTLFRQLSSFYKQASQLQYFQSLITVPSLPKTQPNFLQQSDLRNYQAPVVVIPHEDPVVDNLVDTSAPEFVVKEEIPQQQSEPTPPPPPTIDYERVVRERDEYIRQLRQENQMHVQQNQTIINQKTEVENQLKDQLMRMNSDLTQLQDEVSNLRIQKEELELKFQTTPDLEQKALAEEEKAKLSEEKFQKLKNMYTQIRDEHIKLLRTHGETTKKLEVASKQATEAMTEKEQITTQLKELEAQNAKISESVQQSSADSDRIKDDYETKIAQLEKEKENLIDQHQNDESAKSAEIAELKISIESLQKIFDELKENSTKLQDENELLEKEKQDLIAQKEEIERTFKVNLEEIKCEKVELEKQKSHQDTESEKLKEELIEKATTISALEVKLSETIKENEEKIEAMNSEMKEKQLKYSYINANYDRVIGTKESLETDIHDLLFQQEEFERRNRALLEACIKATEETSVRTIQENETPGFQINATYFIMVSEELQDVLTKLKSVHEDFTKDNNPHTDTLVRTTVRCSHLLNLIHERGMAICNKSTNINSGEKIADEIKEFGQSTLQLYQALYQENEMSNEVSPTVDKLKEMLYRITNMIGDISSNNDEIDKLGDLVEKELNYMDKAIEEAAKKIVDMLEQSRASDSGIKLEVNEKILDSCTSLMQAIQILVQKSRKVQAEIIALGKGTASAKEFYKRNHQWTEGMISAAKSVAVSATLLVDAANKSVNGQSNHTLEIVVAAQEIAACVAALVVSSKVKAPRDSPNLKELTIASKDVTQSTGTVVATAKSCSQRLEDSQNDLDFTKLTVHQAKTKEMEVQVRVLELEQALQVERMRLAALRRQNYQEE